MGIGLTRQERRRLRIGVLFALPWIVGFLSFTVFPVVYSFYYSLNVFTTFGQPLHWVGLSNYIKLVNDDLFWKSPLQHDVHGGLRRLLSHRPGHHTGAAAESESARRIHLQDCLLHTHDRPDCRHFGALDVGVQP